MDEKPTDMEHKEVMAQAEVEYGLRKSRFDDLSIPRTLWVFRRTVLVVLSVYTGKSDLNVMNDILSCVGYLCEGFEVSIAWASGTSLTL
jgi:hypothetical protein